MKNGLITFLLLVLLISICTGSFSETMLDMPYGGICPHALRVQPHLTENHKAILADVLDIEAYVSAVCDYCQQDFMLYPQDAHCVPGSECGKGCSHVYRQISIPIEAEWIAVDEVTHEYRTFYLAQCVQCLSAVRYYIAAPFEKPEDAFHEWNPAWLDTHMLGAGMHLSMTSCLQCGQVYMISEPCAMLENGLCLHRFLDALDKYGLE